jgi:molybdate transport system substrate-binding protein
MRRVATTIVLALLLILAASRAQAQEVMLSVAISMKDVVEELGKGFMASRPGVILRYNFGSSGELQKQIEAGAPVDLFISAAQRQMDELEKRKLIATASRKVFARNVLTVIKPADSKIDITKPADLLEARVTRIVVGSPRTVPAGQYAEESLKALGLWDKLQPKLVFSENVRQALDYVARGEVDAGFVYTTDAATRGTQVKEAFRAPEDTYRPVLYPAAVVAASKHADIAQAYLDLLLSREGRAVLARHGFLPPPRRPLVSVRSFICLFEPRELPLGHGAPAQLGSSARPAPAAKWVISMPWTKR